MARAAAPLVCFMPDTEPRLFPNRIVSRRRARGNASLTVTECFELEPEVTGIYPRLARYIVYHYIGFGERYVTHNSSPAAFPHRRRRHPRLLRALSRRGCVYAHVGVSRTRARRGFTVHPHAGAIMCGSCQWRWGHHTVRWLTPAARGREHDHSACFVCLHARCLFLHAVTAWAGTLKLLETDTDPGPASHRAMRWPAHRDAAVVAGGNYRTY
jgi:hypothetical protein